MHVLTHSAAVYQLKMRRKGQGGSLVILVSFWKGLEECPGGEEYEKARQLRKNV